MGFNPGERSAALGHYYAGRGNQFWNFLYESGLISVRLAPEEDFRLLEFGFGLTDLVKRWSKSSSELNAQDFRSGIPSLKAKLLEASPRTVAFNGKTAFEKFQGRRVDLGCQPDLLGNSRIFVLPSTSGRNVSLSRRQKLEYFCRLAKLVQEP